VTDLRVSRVGLGCNNFGWRLDLEGTRAVVEAALEAGITHFDTAETYGDGNSERFLGELLEGRREDVVIATKFGGRQKAAGSRDYIRRAIESSLERLRTDYVDLYYYHRPDGVTPIAGQKESTRRSAGALSVVPSGWVTGYPMAVRMEASNEARIGSGELQVAPPSVDLLQTADEWQFA